MHSSADVSSLKHMKWTAVLLAMLLSAIHPMVSRALNPDTHLFQYGHRTWRIQDGLLQSPPERIAQTTDGYIWLGTNAGIMRFDGVRFVPWLPNGNEEFRTAHITALLGTRDGSLWIADLKGELWQYRNGTTTIYRQPGFALILSIVEGQNGAVWFARAHPTDSAGSICEAKNGEVRCYRLPGSNLSDCCAALAMHKDGDLWLGYTDLSIWRPGSSSLSSLPIKGAPSHSNALDSISILPDGSAWLGIEATGPGLGLEHYDHGALTAFRSRTWDSSNVAVFKTLLDSRGALWIGTTTGLYRIFQGEMEHFDQADGLSDDRVFDLHEDPEGNLWAATAEGLDCFKDLAVTTFSSSHHYLQAREFDSVLVARDGVVWTGGDGAIDLLREGRPPTAITGKELPGAQLTSMLQDHRGQMWIGLDDTLSVVRDGRFVPIKRADGSSVGFVMSLAESQDGTIWAAVKGVHRELLSIVNGRVSSVFSEPAIPSVRVVAASDHNDLWLGLMNGDLARYHGGAFEVFHFTHDVGPPVLGIEVDRNGTVMAVAYGLIGWNQGKQQIMTTKNGLPCNGINALIRDGHNSLWLYTQCGLVEISASEIDRWWNDPRAVLQMRIFDVSDGVRPGPAPFRGSARGLDGKLWFVNEDSLQMIDPDHLPTNHIPPPVWVEGIIVKGQSYAVEQMHLPPLTQDVAIRYTALSFVAPEKVLFRYMLLGQDKVWQDAGTRREALYTNLSPGTYHFLVVACNNQGLWSPPGASLSFTIDPAYYQTKWFAFLCIAAASAILWYCYVLRLRHIRLRVEQRLGAQLEERERIARELHDTLLQGFQGVMLRLQSVLKTLPSEQPAHQMVEGVLDRADEVMFEGRQSVRDLRTVGVTGQELAQSVRQWGEDLAGTMTPSLSITTVGESRSMGPIAFNEICRILREAVTNAFTQSQAAIIEVELTYDDTRFYARVRDDGIGIHPDVLGQGKPNHWGLLGMRERAKKLGAQLNIWSRTGAGTEVEVIVPAGIAYLYKPKDTVWQRLSRRFIRRAPLFQVDSLGERQRDKP